MQRRTGFVLIELLVVFAIVATLLGLGYVRATSIERRAPLTATVNTLVADTRAQQTKAMSGYTQGSGSAGSYGVYFQTNQYVLFKGSSFNAADPSNAAFPLPTNIIFSAIAVPASSIVYAQGSGDVAGFSPSAHAVTVTQGLTGESKTITINRYGAVTSVE